jgi:hypothetical protein
LQFVIVLPAGAIWWLPVSAQYVEWLQEVVEYAAAVEWQFAQFLISKVVPAAECTGLFVAL